MYKFIKNNTNNNNNNNNNSKNNFAVLPVEDRQQL